MSRSLNTQFRKFRHWFDIPLFLSIGAVYLWVWAGAFGNRQISESLWNVVVPVAKDGIAAGMTVTSILLPAAVALIAFIKEKLNSSDHIAGAVAELLMAAGVFILSLGVALFNFSHLPIRIKPNMHIAFDWVVGTLTITQFVLIFLGIFKILKGAYFLSQDGLQSNRRGEQQFERC